MNKYIAIKDFRNMLLELNKKVFLERNTAMAILKGMIGLPTIDIVYCRECKHNKNICINHGKMNPRCRYANYKRSGDGFCSYGERVDNE